MMSIHEPPNAGRLLIEILQELVGLESPIDREEYIIPKIEELKKTFTEMGLIKLEKKDD